ncbi:MAG: peptide-methionine (S)-S-oxide reductase MsrA, partial [Caulobacteraceae bacterium]
LTFLAAPSFSACSPAREAVRLPPPAPEAAPAKTGGAETAILAGGCFWGIQGVFEHVRGVKQALAGYDGGRRSDARYETVSTGMTGHAESVKITFDPSQISYGEILRIFFSVATDPTEVNRQFPDEGPQYRSEIFYTSPGQKTEAERYIAELGAARAFARPIATKVAPDTGFYRAEAYHQNYLERHPQAPYIALYDLPKLAALKAAFPSDYRARPVLAS